jgi:hypothetical protein
VPTGREQSDLHLRKIEAGEVLDSELAITDGHLHAHGTLARKSEYLANGELSLRQYFEHGFPDDARGADDGYIESICHCPVYVMAGVPD